MSIRYIGSKTRIAHAIIERIGKPDGGVFVDAFCGTGAVAQVASRAGWDVLVNDHLISSAILSFARVISSRDAVFNKLGGYKKAINCLNMVKPINGFIWREYSPGSLHHSTIARMYFTKENAGKIDAIRKQIRLWTNENLINDVEEKVLIADLIEAANRVANTAGTYGCFLSKWQRQSLVNLKLIPRSMPKKTPSARMTTCDVLEVECKPEDTIYLDPPYTKRQYAAYYHILETIALGDEPVVEGVCGIRPWHNKASDYCYKLRAIDALKYLVHTLPSRRIFLSYSTEGHASLAALLTAFGELGKVVKFEIEQVGRYRPNRAASDAASNVGEMLFYIEKNEQEIQVAA